MLRNGEIRGRGTLHVLLNCHTNGRLLTLSDCVSCRLFISPLRQKRRLALSCLWLTPASCPSTGFRLSLKSALGLTTIRNQNPKTRVKSLRNNNRNIRSKKDLQPSLSLNKAISSMEVWNGMTGQKYQTCQGDPLKQIHLPKSIPLNSLWFYRNLWSHPNNFATDFR